MKTIEEIFELQKDKCEEYEKIKLLNITYLFLDIDHEKYELANDMNLYTTKDGLLYRKKKDGTFKFYTGSTIIAVGEPDLNLEFTNHERLFVNVTYEGEKFAQVMEFDFIKKLEE